MDQLLLALAKDYPELVFAPGEAFCWSPKTQTIIYASGKSRSESQWALLHEVGHALLGHHTYRSDLDLLSLESQAWETAKELSQNYNCAIDQDHIEDCMDTYRDWLHQRSACPICATHSLQRDAQHYQCHNCGQVWTVTASRFCRPYRRKEVTKQKSPQITPEATFV